MPGFTTHYLFGLNTYQSLKNDDMKKIIFDHHAAYSLGLQGPDIFFYYLVSYAVHGNNIGSVAHIRSTGKFLTHLIESRNLFPDKKEAAIAKAYIMGFVGHYLLDCRCHPYIYWRTHYRGRTPSYYGGHMNLETDIDTELLELYKHRLPSAFRKESTIILTRLELRTISTLLYYVYTMTYPDIKAGIPTMRLAIRSMQLGVRLLHDPHGRKKVVSRKLESWITGYPVLSPMIPSDSLCFYSDPLNILHRTWRNPWDESRTSRASFPDLMEDAQEAYQKLLASLYHLFCIRPYTDSARHTLREILTDLGNQSYHSGMDPALERPDFQEA